jgi:histidinol-phosphate aminotransferase
MTAPVPKPWIDAIAPYVPGRSTTDDGRKVAKLSSNENALGTSPGAREAYLRAVETLDRYPDASAVALRAAIAAHHGIDAARVIHGTGSDEILHLAAGAFAGVGDEVLFVRYGFSVYPIAARRVGAVPVEADDRDSARSGHAANTGRVRRQSQQPHRHLYPPCRNRAAACRPAARLPAGDRSGLFRISRPGR